MKDKKDSEMGTLIEGPWKADSDASLEEVLALLKEVDELCRKVAREQGFNLDNYNMINSIGKPYLQLSEETRRELAIKYPEDFGTLGEKPVPTLPPPPRGTAGGPRRGLPAPWPPDALPSPGGESACSSGPQTRNPGGPAPSADETFSPPASLRNGPSLHGFPRSAPVFEV